MLEHTKFNNSIGLFPSLRKILVLERFMTETPCIMTHINEYRKLANLKTSTLGYQIIRRYDINFTEYLFQTIQAF